MTLQVTSDIIGGNTFGLTSNGPVATRQFLVESDAGPVTITDALLAVGIVYGDVHPETGGSSTFEPIYALDFQARTENDQNTVFTVVISYSRPDVSQQPPSTDPDDSLIQVGSNVTGGKTQVDNTGAQIMVSLTGYEPQVGDVEIQVPETVILFERKEAGSPLTKSLANTGRVNSSSLGSGTYAARTLLCLGIEGVSTDNGINWQVTYRFQYRPDTWDATVVYIDPETDRPADSINIAGNDGVEIVQIYPTADFSSLNLNW